VELVLLVHLDKVITVETVLVQLHFQEAAVVVLHQLELLVPQAG
jgi:hypothetical protein